MIREYFHTIDLDPGFRIAEEGELKLLKQDVMKELLEAKYEEGNEDFLRFVETFATGREDLQVEEIISRLYEFAGRIIRIRRSGWMTVQGCTKRAGKKPFILKR